MQRVTISLPEDLLQELEENATVRGMSLAKYLRELIEQNHQLSEAKERKPRAINEAPATKLPAETDVDFLKYHLEWTLESRYLLRYLIDSLEQQSSEKRATVLSTATEKAQKLVAELLEKA